LIDVVALMVAIKFKREGASELWKGACFHGGTD
jgi:hypothetical protein